jgi:nicotinamidase-related amidase
MKALIIIDYVYDFVADDGKLTAGRPAQAIDKVIAGCVDRFAAAGDFIVTASDCHTAGDAFSPERALFPAHCLAGTSGAALYGATAGAVAGAPAGQVIAIDKARYSAFAGTSLDMKLRERGVTEVYLAGVCTDICVLHTAIDAYNLGYRLHVFEHGVASFNPAGHAFALSHFKNSLGATIE